jgi:hypothetical protein
MDPILHLLRSSQFLSSDALTFPILASSPARSRFQRWERSHLPSPLVTRSLVRLPHGAPLCGRPELPSWRLIVVSKFVWICKHTNLSL